MKFLGVLILGATVFFSFCLNASAPQQVELAGDFSLPQDLHTHHFEGTLALSKEKVDKIKYKGSIVVDQSSDPRDIELILEMKDNVPVASFVFDSQNRYYDFGFRLAQLLPPSNQQLTGTWEEAHRVCRPSWGGGSRRGGGGFTCDWYADGSGIADMSLKY